MIGLGFTQGENFLREWFTGDVKSGGCQASHAICVDGERNDCPKNFMKVSGWTPDDQDSMNLTIRGFSKAGLVSACDNITENCEHVLGKPATFLKSGLRRFLLEVQS